MITFRPLSDDHPDLAHSPLLRAALLTLQYTQEHGAIGLTQTKAFKRVFVHCAVEHFDWPGSSAVEMFRYNKVINEYEFPPLEVLHYLLITLRLGPHFKGEFRLTKRGAELAQAPAQLFAELIPFYVLQIDHASYARFEERPFGKWDVWMNVINVEADHGTTERALFAAFYGDAHDWDNAGWREMAAFSSCVLRPLEWAGLLVQTREEREGRHVHHVFKTPLWRSARRDAGEPSPYRDARPAHRHRRRDAYRGRRGRCAGSGGKRARRSEDRRRDHGCLRWQVCEGYAARQG